MNQSITQDIDSGLLKIGLYQIGGALIGLFIVGYVCFTSTSPATALVVATVMLPVFIYSGICGYRCLKRKKNALKYSLINQLLQLVGFSFGGFAFQYVAGLSLTIGFDETDASNSGLDFGLSQFSFRINGADKGFSIFINLVAAFIIFWILRLLRKQKEINESLEIAFLGSQQETVAE